MRRLKWAGYGHNQRDPLNPEPGSLANFCPACPQVGINIPENWKDNVNQWVTKYFGSGITNDGLDSDLFLNTYLWLMKISKPITFDKRIPKKISGYGMEVGWPQIRLNITSIELLTVGPLSLALPNPVPMPMLV
jgi:hypothetical protein